MNSPGLRVCLPSHKGRKDCVMKFKLMVAIMAVTAAAFVSYAGGPCCAEKAEKAKESGNEAAACKAMKSGEEAAACEAMKSGEEAAACKAMKKSGDKAAGCGMMKKAGCAPKLPDAPPAPEEAAAPAE